jgi:hypothetical protein
MIMVLVDVWASATKEDFPSTIQEVINLIGLSPLVALYRHFGTKPDKRKGVIRRIYIPKKVKIDHSLVELIGIENLTILSFHWGGLWIDLPSCKSLFKRVRDEQIRRDYDALRKICEDKTTALFSVARKFELSAETIKKICRDQ